MSSEVIGRDADATRRRLLDAATREFAAHGIAGARVDRIAADARSNKAQIYHYFGSKDGLFDAVFDEMCRDTVDAVPIDPADLPEYAGRLFDSYRERPWVQRLATWYRLERAGSGALLPVVLESYTAKVRAVADGQAAGLLTTRFSAPDLLGLVVHLSGFWSSNVPEFDALLDGHQDGNEDRHQDRPQDDDAAAGTGTAAHRRAVVVAAVAALLA